MAVAPSDVGTLSELKTLLHTREEACRDKDIDRLMSLYSPDCTYFDIVPPLKFTGSAAIRANFQRWFNEYQGAIGLETRDLDIAASGDVAFAHMLHRDSGTMKDGQERSIWVRSTVCCRHSNHRWLITHEHISAPLDLKSGRGTLDLVP